MIQERPQPVAMIVQLFAHPAQQSIPAELAAQQQGFDLLADRREQPFQTAARERARRVKILKRRSKTAELAF